MLKSANTLFEENKYEQALELYETIYKTNKNQNVAFFTKMAICYKMLKDFTASEKILNTALQTYKNDANCLFELAVLKKEQGEFSNAANIMDFIRCQGGGIDTTKI